MPLDLLQGTLDMLILQPLQWRAEKMTNEQDIIYEFGRELNDQHAVTDRTYARALARFGEQGVMDLVGVNGFYSLISMALNVGRTPLPAGVAPALKPMPR